jgi:hypothetical protein
MNKWLELLIGLILLLVPIYLWVVNLWGFGDAALAFLQGGAVWIVMLIGLLFIILGISDLKN